MTGGGNLRICAIILAAGESKRFGEDNKLLAKVDGIAILERVVSAITRSDVHKTIVVTGEAHEAIASLLSGYQIELVQNGNWRSGMGSSLSKGLGRIEHEDYRGILICLGDLPNISQDAVRQVIAAFKDNAGVRIVVPECEGRRGHPVLLPVSFCPQMLELTGNAGAREIIRDADDRVTVVKMSSPGILEDIDTKADWDDLVNRKPKTD